MARDFFQQFREYKWRDVSFPTTGFRLRLSQDIAEHKFVGRDGASLEGTGRAPLEFEASVPFFNDIDPGPTETWKRGTLFPKQWRKFIAACADKSTGPMQHPELGIVRCIVKTMETDWSFATRGGVVVNVSWIEDTTDPNAFASLITAISPLAGAIQAGADIDRHLKTITPPLPSLPVYQPNFQDTMRKIQGVFDQETLLSRRITGVIDNVVYRVQNIDRAMFGAAVAGNTAVDHVKNWPMRDALERMKAACSVLKAVTLSGTKPIGIYLPPRTGTMGKLASEIPAPITDLMQLNPDLCESPVIPHGSKVRYFLAAA